MQRLILWDIDGTVTFSDGIGSRAINRAAQLVADLAHVPTVDMHGKTDPQILREIFQAADVESHEVDAMLDEAMRLCEAELAAAEAELRVRGGLYPGVAALLERLGATAGVRQTLLTGNLAANAAVKVGAFDLTHHFDFEVGAYGSDHADRLELVPIALERVQRLRGETYAPEEVWVIGDTANDLACARIANVRCLLVGTGSPGWDGVRALGADLAVPDLGDVDLVYDVLVGS